jgi:hypothetical protein
VSGAWITIVTFTYVGIAAVAGAVIWSEAQSEINFTTGILRQQGTPIAASVWPAMRRDVYPPFRYLDFGMQVKIKSLAEFFFPSP